MSDSDLQYDEFAPPLPLGRYVRCVWRLTGPARLGVAPEPIVPDGCVELVLNFGDPFVRYIADGASHLQPRHLVAGQITKAIRIAPSGRVDLLGIRFHPWSAGAFFSVSGEELRDAIVPLDEVAVVIERALAATLDTRSGPAQLERLVAALTAHALRARPVHGSTAHVVKLATTAREPLSVRSLALEVGLSTRRVQTMFRETVGLSPKQLLRLMRFQRALALRRGNDALSWSGVAARAGYHDQAHLIREAREIAGCTPAALLRQDAGLTESFLTE